MEGELNNIEDLFQEHYEFLCNVANKMLNDPDASRDIVQDVFLQLWRKRNELKITHSMRAYLYRAVFNGSLQYLEKGKRTLKIVSDTPNIPGLTHSDVEEKVVFNELERDYKSALDLLPPKCRAIFV